MTRLLAALLPLLLAAEPLHERIDRLIDEAAKGKPASPPADDAELLRRAYLDLAGIIPDMRAVRAFLDAKEPDKRAKLNDPLLLSWLVPRPGNLVDRLGKLKDGEVAQELYLAILTRRPHRGKAEAVAKALAGEADRARSTALGAAGVGAAGLNGA